MIRENEVRAIMLCGGDPAMIAEAINMEIYHNLPDARFLSWVLEVSTQLINHHGSIKGHRSLVDGCKLMLAGRYSESMRQYYTRHYISKCIDYLVNTGSLERKRLPDEFGKPYLYTIKESN